MMINNKTPDGKRRILSIIADDFTYAELELQLGVSAHTILEAHKHARFIGYGAPPLFKPIVQRVKLSEESLVQFEVFFSNKENVNMSSYKTDSETGLPVLYLQDTKALLWKKFSESFPNGMRRTSFMTRLQGNRYQYKEDLGGLCSTCNECGYEVFVEIEDLIDNYVSDIQLREWYDISPRRWLFLEAGEAKTAIDSHHAQISHAIKRWVKIGHEIEEGEDIENAIKDLSGTHVSHLEPDRDKEKGKLGTINGISNWHEFTWPETGENTGYICIRALPEFGNWNKISHCQIDKITKSRTFEKPTPIYTTHTQPSKSWTVPLTSRKENTQGDQEIQEVEEEQIEDMDIDPISKSAIVFGCGWALSENLKVNQKVPTKRITEHVKGLLTIMFHSGTANPRLKMNANEMHEELLKRVTDNEISKDDVPKVSTIANWITSTSRSFKKTMALRLLEEAESSEQ
ncbi:hypothetical protein RhiirC2_829008 [Rhizophagus irregularis]|uniref:Uncharacterized protein n=1 Tax=Rhizophagus irregularis TaxID=588596 RepID=A0A2N1NAR3_9GLOM|nr:hypothetical protein RhiirC2_829008 [Rhizophagus irregularis]